MNRQRIAVIGGVASGPAAAAEARRTDPGADIVLFEEGRHISYGACEIPLFLDGTVSEPEQLVAFTPERFRAERGVDVRTGTRVERVEARNGVLHYREAASGELLPERFDKFILATGAAARRPPGPGIEAENVFVVRHLVDAVRLDRYRRENAVDHAVVVGGGYVGIETAEALSRHGLRVSIVQPEPGPLHAHLGPQIAGEITRLLEDRGIAVRLDRFAGLLESSDGRVRAVRTQSGEFIGCQLVVLAIGISPATSLAEGAGVRLGSSGGIRVDDGMRTNLPNVWACGDGVEVRRVIDDASVLSPLSLTAFRTGRVAGRNAARRGALAPARFPGVVGGQGLKIFDQEAAYVGLTLEEATAGGFSADSVSIRHRTRAALAPESASISVTLVFERPRGRLLGAQLFGGSGTVLRADILIPLIRRAASVQELYELDLIYAPSFSPRLDPLLVAAKKAMDGLAGG